MPWQFFVAMFLVFGTVSYLVRRELAQTIARYNRLINGFFFLCVLYPIGLVTAFATSPNLAVGWDNIIIMLSLSGLFPVIMVTSFQASKYIDAGLYTILNNLTPIITIASASLLLNQTLNTQQMVGAAVIISSAVIITLPRLRKHKTGNVKGTLLALVSVLLLGFTITYESWMLTRIDYGAYLVYGWGAQTLWMTFLAWPQRHAIGQLKRTGNNGKVLTYAFANALKGLSFVAALKVSGNASLVGATVSFLAVLVVIAAYVSLKEKDYLWLKIAAASIGSIGLFILNTS